MAEAVLPSDEECVNTIRSLAADMVQQANSGHPGAPMGLAPAAHVLWTRHFNMDPTDYDWPNRDRFVLSNGHACALHYSMLHLGNPKSLKMGDLKAFRQLNSTTPGHPESHDTVGVEATTGPLGQGICNAVGFAMGAKHAAAKYNKEGFPVVDHKVVAICGDGCLQEGVSSEACSLAGHHKLDNLIVIYDDNTITIDGHTDLSFSEDVPARFRAYGWNTITVSNGNTDFESISAAIQVAKEHKGQPTLISVKTIIGWGSSKQDTHGVHGAPLGDAVLAEYKKFLNRDPEKRFHVDEGVYRLYQETFATRGAQKKAVWSQMFEQYSAKFPELAAEYERIFIKKALPENWKKDIPNYTPESKLGATRNYSGEVLNGIAVNMPELIGGSADLTPSNKTQLKCSGDFQPATPEGRYFRFGVREHGMFAIGNGLALYGYTPFTATFLNFITYGWGAARLSALSRLQQIFIMTHGSVFLGEDGPTHQPIEVFPLMRACPNMLTFRPADGAETAGAYVHAIEKFTTGPSVLCFSRQKCPHLAGTKADSVSLGAYRVLGDENANLILIGTGSEVSLCCEAAKLLESDECKVAVVSAPCLELFDQQSLEYRQSILPPGVKKVSVEAASTYGWKGYSDFQIGIDRFGASAPLNDIRKFFGFTPEQVAEKVKSFQ